MGHTAANKFYKVLGIDRIIDFDTLSILPRGIFNNSKKFSNTFASVIVVTKIHIFWFVNKKHCDKTNVNYRGKMHRHVIKVFFLLSNVDPDVPKARSETWYAENKVAQTKILDIYTLLIFEFLLFKSKLRPSFIDDFISIMRKLMKL